MQNEDTENSKTSWSKRVIPFQLLILLLLTLVPVSTTFSQGRKGLDANVQSSRTAEGHTEGAISDLQWRVMLDCALTKIEKQEEALRAADELLAHKNDLISSLEKRDVIRLREIAALNEQLESIKRLRVLDQEQLDAKNRRIAELEKQLGKAKSRTKFGFLGGAAIVALLIALL